MVLMTPVQSSGLQMDASGLDRENFIKIFCNLGLNKIWHGGPGFGNRVLVVRFSQIEHAPLIFNLFPILALLTQLDQSHYLSVQQLSDPQYSLWQTLCSSSRNQMSLDDSLQTCRLWQAVEYSRKNQIRRGVNPEIVGVFIFAILETWKFL